MTNSISSMVHCAAALALNHMRIASYAQLHNFYSGGVIPQLDLAYETWGELNDQRSNAILLFTGLSASSHACSTQVYTQHMTLRIVYMQVHG